MNLSVDTIKKNLKWIACAALGLLHFILLFFPYFGASASFGGYSESDSLSGYETFGEDMTEMNAGGLVGFAQIITLLAAIALLGLGVYILLKEIVGIEVPESFGPVRVKMIANIAHLAYAGLNVLTLLALIIAGIANSRSAFGAKISCGPHIGIFLAILLAAGSAAVLFYLEKNNPEFAGGNTTKFVCSQCGANATANQAFCKVCGGQVCQVANVPTTYVCSQCNTPAKAGVNFCPVCGGQIVEVLPQVIPTYACEQCGASAKEGTAFCAQCGGKIIQK